MTVSKNNKVLFVDDDINLLNAIARHYRNKYEVVIAEGGTKGLETLKAEGPFAVVVSDMRMPDMNGIQFLAKAREINRDTVRIMLTGNADLNTAVHAVNEGNIFRFLVKPCKKELLEWAVEAAFEQYKLITAEKELLENTLKGSIHVLIDILSISSPMAFSRASRLKDYVSQIINQLSFKKTWEFELAALLSQIGCIALPNDILSKVHLGNNLTEEEATLYNSYPELGAKIISRIPRLETVAEMILNQQQPFSETGLTSKTVLSNQVVLGAQLLKTVTDFDSLIYNSNTKIQALITMRSNAENYIPIFLKALENVKILNVESEVKEVDIKELNDSMLLAQDIFTKNGLLVAPKGQQITLSLRVRLENYAYRKEIQNKIMISLAMDREQPSNMVTERV